MSELIDDFLTSHDSGGMLAEQLRANGNAGYGDSLSQRVVVVPIRLTTPEHPLKLLLHLKSRLATSALSTEVIAWLNYPHFSQTDSEIAGQNLSEVQTFQQTSDIPFSYALVDNGVRFTIGSVRGDAIATTLHSISDKYDAIGRQAPDIQIVETDADTQALPARYFPKLDAVHEAGLEAGKEAILAWPRTVHERLDEDQFPRVNRLLAWYDLRQKISGGSSANNHAMNANAYVRGGGYGWDSAGELYSLTDRIYQEIPESAILSVELPDRAITSSRHLLSLMSQGKEIEYSGLKYHGCRRIETALVDYTQNQPEEDVSLEYFSEAVDKLIYEAIRAAYGKFPISKKSDHALASEYAVQFGRNASVLLGGVEDEMVRGVVDKWTEVVSYHPRYGDGRNS